MIPTTATNKTGYALQTPGAPWTPLEELMVWISYGLRSKFFRVSNPDPECSFLFTITPGFPKSHNIHT